MVSRGIKGCKSKSTNLASHWQRGRLRFLNRLASESAARFCRHSAQFRTTWRSSAPPPRLQQFLPPWAGKAALGSCLLHNQLSEHYKWWLCYGLMTKHDTLLYRNYFHHGLTKSLWEVACSKINHWIDICNGPVMSWWLSMTHTAELSCKAIARHRMQQNDLWKFYSNSFCSLIWF